MGIAAEKLEQFKEIKADISTYLKQERARIELLKNVIDKLPDPETDVILTKYISRVHQYMVGEGTIEIDSGKWLIPRSGS